MIGAHEFVSSYQSFWTKTTPWLNSFVSSLNKGGVERVFKPLEFSEEPRFRSINSEAAFVLLEQPSLRIEDALSKSFDRLKFLPRNSVSEYELDANNERIIRTMSDRLINIYGSRQVLFNPLINGSGAIKSCFCDLVFDKTLCEIKSGDRKFNSSDFKQVIFYLALNNFSKQYEFEDFELFNPRTGFLVKMKINDLLESVSDFSPEEIYQEIINVPDNFDGYQ